MEDEVNRWQTWRFHFFLPRSSSSAFAFLSLPMSLLHPLLLFPSTPSLSPVLPCVLLCAREDCESITGVDNFNSFSLFILLLPLHMLSLHILEIQSWARLKWSKVRLKSREFGDLRHFWNSQIEASVSDSVATPAYPWVLVWILAAPQNRWRP